VRLRCRHVATDAPTPPPVVVAIRGVTMPPMHTQSIDPWRHEHVFGQDRVQVGEKRTLIVIVITAVTMVVEIVAGIMFGSMALLADGLHMGSHAVALVVAAFAYIYARRHAADDRFSFGTGKVNALGGFTGALLLVLFTVIMAWESVHRLFSPVNIAFNQAIVVAVIGLAVNAVCAVILSVPTGQDEQADHHHDGDHQHAHHHDHNLRSAYFHVIADALTSVLAIVALFSGKLFGLTWMDPVMGIVGAVMIAHWSWGLLRSTSHVLLDHRAPAPLREAITQAIEQGCDDRVSDLHVWSIGPGIHAAIVAIVTDEIRPAQYYKDRLPDQLGLTHVTIETHLCTDVRTAAQLPT